MDAYTATKKKTPTSANAPNVVNVTESKLVQVAAAAASLKRIAERQTSAVTSPKQLADQQHWRCLIDNTRLPRSKARVTYQLHTIPLRMPGNRSSDWRNEFKPY